MKFLTAFLLACILIAPAAYAAPPVGQPAPDFTASDINGQPFKLSDQKGKIVVLEWTNHECPFVHKHYDSGNMQNLQKDAGAHGVVWVSIVSSAPGHQGNVTPEEAKKIMTGSGAAPAYKILDPSGEIGHLYDAKTTPNMYVIDKDGLLVYEGAIDDQPSPNPKTLEGARNYVTAALDSLMKGEKIETPVTQPYGCAVKYEN